MPKNKKNIRLTSTCDDEMFMSSEIHLDFQPSDGLNGVALILQLQCKGDREFWSYLRKGEIKQLIDNLQKVYDLIPDK